MCLVCRRWFLILTNSIEVWRYLCLPKTEGGRESLLSWARSRQNLRPKYVCDDEDIYFPGSSTYMDSKSKSSHPHFLTDKRSPCKDFLLGNLASFVGDYIEEIRITRSQSIELRRFLAQLPCLKTLQVSSGLVEFRGCSIASPSLELQISDAAVLFGVKNTWDSLKALDLTNCQLHIVDGLHTPTLTNLKSLKLSRCKFLDADYSLWQMENLEQLTLHKCKGSCRCAKVANFSLTLKHLVLVDVVIPENLDLATFDRLESLVIEECEIEKFPFSRVPPSLKLLSAYGNPRLSIGNQIDVWNVSTLKLSPHQVFNACGIDCALQQGLGNVVHLTVNITEYDCRCIFPFQKFRNLPKLKTLSITRLDDFGESRFHWTWVKQLIELQKIGVDVEIVNADCDKCGLCDSTQGC